MKQFILESECLWALPLLLVVRFHDWLIEAEMIEVDCTLFRDISIQTDDRDALVNSVR